MLTQGLANVAGRAFADIVRSTVLEPIEARSAAFGPRPRDASVATERDDGWRQKRLRGEVHDENAFAVGGIAGHAGLFGTAADVAAIARVYRDGAVIGNDLARLARTEHVKDDNVRRGLGLALRAPREPMVGRYMSLDAYGHTGFTGTSLWVDPAIDLTVIILTNRVYFGRKNDDAMYRFRIAVHEAVSRPFAEAAA
jgi:CubicO group peptidase (beta-lactamase class C family)